MNGLNIFLRSFHPDLGPGHFPGAKKVVRDGREGNAAIAETEFVTFCCYVRLSGEKFLDPGNGDSPVFVFDHGYTPFSI